MFFKFIKIIMVILKAFLKNYFANLGTISKFSRILVTLTYSMLNSATNLLQQHRPKSIFFPITFILGLFGNLFMAIDFIKFENKNLRSSSDLIFSITILTLITTVLFFNSGCSFIVGVCILTAMNTGALFNISLFI